MDEQTVKELYQFNVNFVSDDFGPMSKKRKVESPQSWAGSTVRLMLQLMFITAMLLLLRFDEVLRITWSDVHFEHYHSINRGDAESGSCSHFARLINMEASPRQEMRSPF